MALTDAAIRNAKPAAKPFKLADGGGLYLLTQPSGGRWWRIDYRFDSKRQNCGQVFRYAVATGRAERDPSGDLRGALAPWKPKHYATIPTRRP
jgi:hypothetical protein